MDGNSERLTPSSAVPWLTVPQQRLIAILIVAAQIGIVVWWLSQGGLTGGLIRLDQATSLECQSQLDINECGWPELTLLPGISETMARRIVRDRGENGRFRELDDLRRIRGVGPKRLAQLRPFLVCRPATGDSLRPKGPDLADEPTQKP
jgi:competence protein ComEA